MTTEGRKTRGNGDGKRRFYITIYSHALEQTGALRSVAVWNAAAVAPLHRTDYGWSPENPHDPHASRCRHGVVRHRARPRSAPGGPPGPRPTCRSDQGPLRRARHRVRDVGLSVPLLPRVRARHAAAARARVRPGRQGPLRLHQPAAVERAQKCRDGRGSRGVRRPAGTVLADARSAVPTPEPVVRPRLPPRVSPRAG